jgi:steroid 5-alpha reductase family enzyme
VEIGGNFIWINWVGFFIFCLGLFWESWADWELQKYKKLKATSFCISGPWKYSRHPNYFGEISLWWGLWLMSLPEGAWAFFSPLLLHLFIVKISGVPLMAKHLERRDGYKQYAERINLLFPMPPKNV